MHMSICTYMYIYIDQTRPNKEDPDQDPSGSGSWVAVEELRLSYHKKTEAVFFYCVFML